MRKSLG